MRSAPRRCHTPVTRWLWRPVLLLLWRQPRGSWQHGYKSVFWRLRGPAPRRVDTELRKSGCTLRASLPPPCCSWLWSACCRVRTSDEHTVEQLGRKDTFRQVSASSCAGGMWGGLGRGVEGYFFFLVVALFNICWWNKLKWEHFVFIKCLNKVIGQSCFFFSHFSFLSVSGARWTYEGKSHNIFLTIC